MPKFLIRAHYRFNAVRLATVDADDRRSALNLADEMGLLDDRDAEDFTATLVQPSK